MRGEQGAPSEVSPGHQGHPGAQRHQHSDGAILVSEINKYLSINQCNIACNVPAWCDGIGSPLCSMSFSVH